MFDIQKLHRSIGINKLQPKDIINLDFSYECINAILTLMNKRTKKFDDNYNFETISKHILDIRNKLNCIDKEKAKITLISQIKESFFIKGYDDELDTYNDEILSLKLKVNKIKNELVETIQKNSNSKVKDKDDCVTIRFSEKLGFDLLLTNRRLEILKKYGKDTNFTIKKQNSSVKLTNNSLTEYGEKTLILQEKIKERCKFIFEKLLQSIWEHHHKLFDIIEIFIMDIDISQSNAFTAIKYNYTKPKIISNIDNSGIKAKNLRHPIIECINTQIDYVPNDIHLGLCDKNNQETGMLVFGCNSAGKSSLMKSIGISIIAAQSGCFVASSNFEYVPFDSIFTRISGDDNIIEGHSSFVVEMLELRDIMDHATTKSLVLCDELSRGTEYNSGTTIVSATFSILGRKKIPFVSATHLHGLAEINEITDQKNIGLYHLVVENHPTKDMLVYKRKLQRGCGESIYGLRIARHIIRNSEFLQEADKIQKKYLLSTESCVRKSNYNKDKIIDLCVICNKKANETHHIKFQCLANKNGFIGSSHKDRCSNLVGLCHICHDKLHNGEFSIDGYMDTNKGIQLSINK